jgi:hypothetical protein
MNNMALNHQGAISTFPVSRSNEVQLIRLRQLGKESSNNDHLCVSVIEVFGVLIETK